MRAKGGDVIRAERRRTWRSIVANTKLGVCVLTYQTLRNSKQKFTLVTWLFIQSIIVSKNAVSFILMMQISRRSNYTND